MKTIIGRYAIGLALAGLLASTNIWAEPAPTFRSYLTARANGNHPGTTEQAHFECSDKIYAVIEVTAPERQKSSEHLLIVNWFNPADKLEQRTRFEFNSYGKGTRVWAWLRLSGSTGASVGQMFDPAFGMGEFIGAWRAEVYIDEKKLDTHHFDVLC